MKTVSAAYQAYLAAGGETDATCWLCVRTDGTVFAATNHDQDIVFDLEAAMVAVGLTATPGIVGIGSRTYAAQSGFLGADLQSSAGLNVDTGEAQGALVSPAITEADMLAGLWDFARLTIFRVNYADLSMGALIEKTGTIGEITTDKGFFKAEWRSLSQAYSQQIGRLFSPRCNAILGDSRCGVDLGNANDSPSGFTHAGTITAVNPDQITLYDTGRTEPGPSGGIAITDITSANPGVVTMASAGTFADGDAVTLSGIVGPELLNVVTVIRNLSGVTWELGIDTSDTAVYPAYSGGGTVTPLGANTGYFDFGLITFTSGLNNGFSMEVKSYVPGQITIQLPMPYDVAIGDTYTIVAGCDKSRDTCRDRFNNIINHRGFPFIPGVDRMVQVGRHK